MIFTKVGTHKYHFTLSSGKGKLKDSNKVAENENNSLIVVDVK